MSKSGNMKQAMHEMFGVGKGAEAETAAPEAAAAAKPATVVAQVTPKKAPEPVASLLAEGTSFEGTLTARGDVEIAGEFKGTLTTEGSVRLRSNIQSSITAKSVELVGCVLTGDITANGTVAVSENSKVVGNVTARAALRGRDRGRSEGQQQRASGCEVPRQRRHRHGRDQRGKGCGDQR